MLHEFSTLHAALPWFFPLAAFLFGTCVGSFLNVVIHRMPRKESVVTPGSHCGCGQPIRWFDNVPVLSWFLLAEPLGIAKAGAFVLILVGVWLVKGAAGDAEPSAPAAG